MVEAGAGGIVRWGGTAMNGKLALIPVDARPVSYDLPCELARLAGREMLVMPKGRLGFLKKPADLHALSSWLDTVAGEVAGIVLSVDMLLYGGLVPSRINTEGIPVIKERLETFLQLKQRNPSLKIMAFSSTMRLSNSYVNEEEKEYWNQYGKEIWKYSWHYHLLQKFGNPEDRAIVDGLESTIPDWVLEDYLRTRERNFEINQLLIELVEQNVIDFLVFPQDDTSEYGLNIMEQEKLKAAIVDRQLHSRIHIYPGADEVASVLTARLIYELEGERYPVYYPMYSGIKGSLSTAMYEDRPIQETVKGQVFALGGHTAESPEEADIILGVNVPGRKQGDLALQVNLSEVDTNDRNIGEWISRLQFHKGKGRPIAVADVAYANGADEAMLPQLLAEIPLQDLSGFAAWNTAGNTLGTAVSQAALLHLAARKGIDAKDMKERLLLHRILDDYLYQSLIRREVRARLDETETPADQLLSQVKELFIPQAEQLLDGLGASYHVTDIHLPWDRTFEVGIGLEKGVAK